MSIARVLSGETSWHVEHGDSLVVLRSMPDACVDAIVTDPPAGIAFMAKAWDDPDAWKAPISESGLTDGGKRLAQPTIGSVRNPMCRTCRRHLRGWKDHPGCECDVPDTDEPANRRRLREQFVSFLTAILAECYRVTKPGGRMLCWSIPRTMHWTGCAIEDAGWEIENTIAHIFGCLSDDTEILTDAGWARRTDIGVGARVAAFDAERDALRWEAVEDVFEYEYNEPAFAIRSGRTDQILSRGHRVVARVDGQWRFLTAEEAWAATKVAVPVVEDVRRLLRDLRVHEALGGAPEGDVLAAVREGGAVTHEDGKVSDARGDAVRASRHAVADLAVVERVHYDGIVWCVKVPSGAFVARRNGKAFITGNSGFPKSKTQLKPAREDWFLARKPAKRVRPMNIDECRVGTFVNTTPSGMDRLNRRNAEHGYRPGSYKQGGKEPEHKEGRWPANLVLSHSSGCNGVCIEGCSCAALDRQSGVLHHRGNRKPSSQGGGLYGIPSQTSVHHGREDIRDSGGASRFFNTCEVDPDDADTALFIYQAKASRADREDGLDDQLGNNHPTVKSTKLMRHFVKLVTAPGDVVLDAFCGSGSTGRGTVLEGRRFIGIEREDEPEMPYVSIARRRIAAAAASAASTSDAKPGQASLPL